MSGGDVPAKFGWRARFARAAKLFGLALVSVFLVEYEVLGLMYWGGGPGGTRSTDSALEGLTVPLTEPFWLLYGVFGLPVAFAHALGSLAWKPETQPLAAHLTLTFVACVAMASAIVANPFFSYVFAIVLLILGHTTCFMGLPPKPRAASPS